MDRLVELAVRVARIKNVAAFRSLVIPLSRLRSNRIAAQRDLVGLDDLALIKKLQRVLLFQNQHAICAECSTRWVLCRHNAEHEDNTSEYSDAHPTQLDTATAWSATL